MHTKFFFYNCNLDSLRSDIVEFTSKNPQYDISIVATMERYPLELIEELIELLSTTSPRYSTLILDDCLYDLNIPLHSTVRIIYIPYFAWKSYCNVFNNFQSRNKVWNPATNKALLLPGKTYKYNRIGLLYSFYQRSKLTNLQWSYYHDEQSSVMSKNFLPKELSDIEYDTFINTIDKKLDDVSISMQNGSMHYVGFPYDVTLYSDTSLSIVSETEDNRTDVSTQQCTEKIYRPILNKHPFIVAGNPYYLQNLKNKGYKTFENYLKLEYDSCEHIWDRMNKVVVNTEYFLAQLSDPSIVSAVRNDIEHNYNLILEITKKLDIDLTKTFDMRPNLFVNFGIPRSLQYNRNTL